MALIRQLDADDIQELSRRMEECKPAAMAASRTLDDPNDELLTVAECAQLAKCHPETIKRQIRMGRLRAVTQVGRSHRILRPDFDEWLAGKPNHLSDVRAPSNVRQPRKRKAPRPMRNELGKLGRI